MNEYSTHTRKTKQKIRRLFKYEFYKRAHTHIEINIFYLTHINNDKNIFQ